MLSMFERFRRRIKKVRRHIHQEWKYRRIVRETDAEVERFLDDAREERAHSDAQIADATLDVRLDIVNSRKVERQARRWGVDLPHMAFVQESGGGPWLIHPDVQIHYLHPYELDRLRPLIKKAKRESISWWVQNAVVPLIGLIGALTGLIAVIKSKG